MSTDPSPHRTRPSTAPAGPWERRSRAIAQQAPSSPWPEDAAVERAEAHPTTAEGEAWSERPDRDKVVIPPLELANSLRSGGAKLKVSVVGHRRSLSAGLRPGKSRHATAGPTFIPSLPGMAGLSGATPLLESSANLLKRHPLHGRHQSRDSRALSRSHARYRRDGRSRICCARRARRLPLGLAPPGPPDLQQPRHRSPHAHRCTNTALSTIATHWPSRSEAAWPSGADRRPVRGHGGPAARAAVEGSWGSILSPRAGCAMKCAQSGRFRRSRVLLPIEAGLIESSPSRARGWILRPCPSSKSTAARALLAR